MKSFLNPTRTIKYARKECSLLLFLLAAIIEREQIDTQREQMEVNIWEGMYYIFCNIN